MSKNALTSRLAPDERPVHVRQLHELVDIVRLDAPAVNDVAVVSRRRAEPLPHA